jgi:DMSO reductase anchor subunit
VLSGSASIFCMSSIYLLPTQSPWNNWITVLLFYGSALVLGATSAAALLVMDAIFAQLLEPELADSRLEILKRSFGWLAGLAAAALVLIVALNSVQLLFISRGGTLAQASLSLLMGLYRPLLGIRVITLFAGVGILIFAVAWLLKRGRALPELVTPFYLACLLAMIAEILGRFLFYAIHVRLGI